MDSTGSWEAQCIPANLMSQHTKQRLKANLRIPQNRHPPGFIFLFHEVNALAHNSMVIIEETFTSFPVNFDFSLSPGELFWSI